MERIGSNRLVVGALAAGLLTGAAAGLVAGSLIPATPGPAAVPDATHHANNASPLLPVCDADTKETPCLFWADVRDFDTDQEVATPAQNISIQDGRFNASLPADNASVDWTWWNVSFATETLDHTVSIEAVRPDGERTWLVTNRTSDKYNQRWTSISVHDPDAGEWVFEFHAHPDNEEVRVETFGRLTGIAYQWYGSKEA